MAKKIDINGLDHFKEKENAMIASEYSSSKTYAVGDYVYHNGTLYKCTTAITTAEAWTSGHWTAAKLADDCSGLMTAITDITNVSAPINLIDPTTIVHGSYWWNDNPQDGNYSRTDLIPIKPSTAYTFANTAYNYWGGSSLRARYVSFFDSTKNIMHGTGVENTTNFTTPSNAVYVVISFLKNATEVLLIEGNYPATEQTMVYVPYTPPALNIDSNTIDSINISQIKDYSVSGKNLFNKGNALLNSYLQRYPVITENSSYFTSEYIPVKAGISYTVSYPPDITQNSARSYVLYDANYQKVSASETPNAVLTITPTIDGFFRFSGYSGQIDATQMEIGSTPTDYEPYAEVFPEKALLNKQQMQQISNVLYGKKWVVCGDSFTNGANNSALIDKGKYIGYRTVYPYLIGNRNEMDIVKFFEGGKTLAFPAEPGTFTNSLTNPNASFYYQNIPADADYITIMLGINDGHHAPSSESGDGEDNTGEIPIGTLDDATTATFGGAWNVVLTWLLTNRPNAHIGILVSNGLDSIEYRTMTINAAKKYGLPYLDLNGDERCRAMIRCQNPDIPSSVKALITQAQAVDPSTNTHPNDAAHKLESTFIENFLRSI